VRRITNVAQFPNILSVDSSGGINQSASRLLLASNEANVIQNGELEKIGPITKVRGYTVHGSAVNDTYSILGMESAYKSDGTQKQIVVANGESEADAYTYNPITDAWTQHHLSLTTGVKAEFENFLDGFFMVDFSDATRWNDLSAWSTSTNVTNAAKARYIKQYLSRIYLGYVVSGGTTYPSRVTYSDLPSGDPLTISWDDSLNYFDVDSDDGDVIKGLEENANRLLIFKENSLFRYDTNTLYKVPGCPGTISNRSIVNLQGATLYLHASGIWLYDGTQSHMISRKIQDIIDGISTRSFAASCGFGSGDHYYLFVGDIENTRKGISITKCLIDYDIAKNAFTYRTLNDTPTIFREYRDDRSAITYNDATKTYNDAQTTYNGLVSSEKRIYFGTDDGYVYEFNKGSMVNGSAIPFIVETKDYYLTVPSAYKLLHHIVVFMNGSRGITVQYRLDDGDWKTLGRVTKAQTYLQFPDAARCQRVRFRILEMSSGGQFSYEGIDIYYSLETNIE